MALFLMCGKYTADSLSKVSKQRTLKAADIVAGCGGKILAGYATLGESDVVIVADLPGIQDALKASIGLTKALGIAFTTAPAVTLEEFDSLAET
ncbi:MAG TPA: GYD domain-containing protein [Chthonomonadales bacterium]|nr:GYD domain-containing protein [Chthonomonadales bacterium]